MLNYACRKKHQDNPWIRVRAGDPALAAQIYAEDLFNHVEDGDSIEVEDHGSYLASFRIVITKGS